MSKEKPKEAISKMERVAKTTAGVLYTSFAALMAFAQAMLSLERLPEIKASIHVVMFIAFLVLTAWCVRYTYRGVRGYRIVSEFAVQDQKNGELKHNDFMGFAAALIGSGAQILIGSILVIAAVIFVYFAFYTVALLPISVAIVIGAIIIALVRR